MPASKTLLVALVCSAIVISSSAASGDEPAPIPAPAKEFFPQPTEREGQLDAALDQHLSIAFQETPLADVAAWFASKLEAPVILDHRSLNDAGISSGTPVTRKVDEISARATIKLVLDDMDLATLPLDGVLMITTQDSAEAKLVTRVYPVADLTPLTPHPVPAERKVGNRPSSGGGMFQVQDGEKNSPSTESQPPKPQEESANIEMRMIADYDALIEVITTTVKPQTWDEVGGAGSVSPMSSAKSIVISQTREVHDEVLELLRALRAAKHASAEVAPDGQ